MLRESKSRLSRRSRGFLSGKRILTAVIVLLVYNCSTPYQPKGALGGYSSNQLKENNYIVSFKGNQHTTAEMVFDYLLRKCAEITIEENGKYFIVYEDSSYIDKTTFETGPELDEQMNEFQLGGFRSDAYLLDRKPEIITDPLQTLKDQKTKIGRTYNNPNITNKSTNVIGVYKIQIFEEQIEGFEDYFFSAAEILEKYYEE